MEAVVPIKPSPLRRNQLLEQRVVPEGFEVHGAVKNGLQLDQRVVLISELLRPLGYRTAAFVSGPYLSRRSGPHCPDDLVI